jgi:nitronate monooxygenase
MLFSDAAKYTTLSGAFTDLLGRGITSRIAKDLIHQEKDFLPFPLQTQFMSHLRKAAIEQKKWDMILFWGGQMPPVLKHTKATELMRSVLEETTNYFDHLRA